MQQFFRIAVTAVLITMTTACSVLADRANKPFTARNRHVEVTQQRLAQQPSYGVVDFEITSTNGRQLTAKVASVGYGGISYDSSQWGWLDARLVPASGAVSIPVPKLEGSFPESVEISVYEGDEPLGEVRLIVSTVASPSSGAVLTDNGHTIKLAGNKKVSFRITPHLASDVQWRFYAIFLAYRTNSGHTY